MKVRQEVKIGAVALVAFILAYLGLNFLKGINIFEPENKYKVYLENLNGTSVATPVMISGYKVGSVQKVDFGYSSGKGYRAELLLGLEPDIRIPRGSIIRVKTNVLSGAVLEITAPNEAKDGFLSSGDSIPFSHNDDIMATVSDKILPQVVNMMPEIMSILKRLDEIANNQAIDSMMRNLNHSSAELNRAMLAINHALKPMPQVMGNVQAMSSNLAAMSADIRKLPIDSLLSNLNATTENLRYMSSQLKSQEGTAGKLLNDPSLYNRLDSLANSADALMKDLKANPKRYVHFSLF